jgi:hypothetical protein
MHPTDRSRGRVLGIPKPLLAGLVVVLAAVSFTAVYSRRTPDAGDGSPSPTTALAAGPQTAQSAITPSGTAQTPGMVVTFRLDPNVTRGLYLGDRWVSPPTFHFAQPGTQYVVQAKLQSIDEWDERADLSGEWSTSDPEMIAITRHDHGEVTIVVRRAGEGQLFVSAGGVTKVLRVQARQTADAMDVMIAQ